jgi:hypothetical protein
MSSGSRTSPGLDFNNTGAPTFGGGAPCPTARFEDRGSGILLAGLCHLCGRATTRRNPDGQPEHDQVPALAWTWDTVLADLAWHGPAGAPPAATA